MYVSSLLHIHLITKNPHSFSKVGPCLEKWGEFAGPHNFSGGFKGYDMTLRLRLGSGVRWNE